MKLWPLILLLFSGCVHFAALPPTDYLCLSKNLAYAEPLWRHEAEQRFNRPVLLICHGWGFMGQMELSPDLPYREMTTESAVQVLCAQYPTRPIVVISCNEAGLKLHAPRAGVWYSTRLVSSWPVSSGPLMPIVHPDWCSSIWEFVEAEH